MITDKEFQSTIQNNNLVFLFGAGISSSLSNNTSYSWYKWIEKGIEYLGYDSSKTSIALDSSTENLIHVVGEVIEETKKKGIYDRWMKDTIESPTVKNDVLADTLKKLLITQDIFVTTNYDQLLEKATGLSSITYEEPDKAFQMIKNGASSSVIHLHGIYNSSQGIDNIIADKKQYETVLHDKGAQFIQQILGTRTLIFIGCGQTTEDGNISQFIEFASKYLKMDIPYYFLHREGDRITDLPANIKPVSYGKEYGDLTLFLEDLASERLKFRCEKNKIVGRTAYSKKRTNSSGLLKYHYANENIPFCGRTDEIRKLKEFLSSGSKFSWWSVTGQAGSGKSRLALELLNRLEINWYGFFLNDDTSIRNIEDFVPFNNTLIIIDYVSGRETVAAKYLSELEKKYVTTAYKLRILLLERDNNRKNGSWYARLTQHFGKYSDIAAKEYSDDFLNLEDLDDSAIEKFIGYVCSQNRLSEDSNRDKELRRIYGEKFEVLRYRPLFLELFVEAWILNGQSFSKYDSFDDVLKCVLTREQEKLFSAFDGNQKCCNAFIRLVLRANVSGNLFISDLPDIYKDDWNEIDKFIKSNAFPGIQQDEKASSLIGSICHNNIDRVEIAPLFPDILKEYMFYYYSDENRLDDVVKELWRNVPRDFSIFIKRCINDFPSKPFYRNVLNNVTLDDKESLVGRLELLKQRTIKDDEDPIIIFNIICGEYEYWKAINATDEILSLLKLSGLNFAAKQFGAWSLYDVSNMMEAIDESLLVEGSDATQLMKQFFLQENITNLAKAGFDEEASYLREKLNELLKEDDASDWKNALQLINLNEEMMGHILSNDFENAYEVLKKMEKACQLKNIESARLFSHSCFNIDNLAFQFGSHYLGKGYELIQKAELLYPDDPQIIARVIGSKVSILQGEYFAEKLDDEDLLIKLVPLESRLLKFFKDEPSDGWEDEDTCDSLSMTAGLLLTLKINAVKNDQAELEKLIAVEDSILNKHPEFDSIASAKIHTIMALHKVFGTKVSHDEVEDAFQYVELNYKSNFLRSCFFEMLELSEDSDKKANYITKNVAFGARQGARYDPLVGGGIPEFDEEADFLRGMVSGTTYIRKHKKIGANEKCPCGSGKKFKKCCKGKGIYD